MTLLRRPLPVIERLRASRDRLLAAPGFRRWAGGFALTRPIARRRARALFDLCAGFVYSQVLLACVRLRVFEALADGAREAEEIASALQLDRDAASCLLEAAASLRLLERRGGGRYGLGALGAVVAGEPAIGAMVEHNQLLYADLADPVALLRRERESTELSRFWPYAKGGAAAVSAAQAARYSELMARSLSLLAAEVLDAVSLRGRRRLLDVGGGSGGFLLEAAARAPHLELVLFDLPAVTEIARRRFAEAGLASRLTCIGGDFLRDPLPAGADVVSLIRVLHDHNDADALHLLKAVYAALAEGGTLVIAEPMAAPSGTGAGTQVYFSLYLLSMGSGKPRSAAQLRELLGRAGFHAVQHRRTRFPLQTGVLIATKARRPVRRPASSR